MKQTVKRTGIAALAAAIVIALTACATAPQIESGDFTYRETETGITITGYTGPGGDVIIPAEIDGKPVTAIGYRAFQRKNLTGISIPNSVTSIGNEAFADNPLTFVNLPYGASLNTMSESSSGGPSTWTWQITCDSAKIADSAFRSVGDEPQIRWTAGALISGNFLYNENETGITISGYTGPGGDVAIPAEINGKPVTAIAESSFGIGVFSNKNLTSVTIPDSITSIGNRAFMDNQLTGVIIGANVTIAHANAFNNGFVEAYDADGKAAGTYTRPNTDSTTWARP